MIPFFRLKKEGENVSHLVPSPTTSASAQPDPSRPQYVDLTE